MGKPDALGDMIRQLARPASGANPAVPGQVLKLVGANMDSLTRINPDLAARIASGDNEAIFDAYRMIVSKGEAMTRRGGPKAAAVMEPEYADVLGMGDKPARQMELPMEEEWQALPPAMRDRGDWEATGRIAEQILSEGPRGLVPFGVRGGGVPVGGVRGPGSAAGGVGGPGVRQGGMIPSGGGRLSVAGSRGMSVGGERGLSVPPGASTGWRQLAAPGAMDDVIDADFAGPGSLDGYDPNFIDDDFMGPAGRGGYDDGIIDAEFELVGPRRNLPGGGRNLPPPAKDSSGRWVYPAMGAAGLAGAAIGMSASRLGDSDIQSVSGDTADLAAESRPVPSVEAESPMVDYSAMAREKIRQANEIQLREGRVTPESAALAREADALYQKAAEGRRTGSQPPIMPVGQQNAQTSAIRAQSAATAAANPGSDYRSQARRLLAELNARASEGNLTNGERQQMMAEINRLYALADEQANQRRAG